MSAKAARNEAPATAQEVATWLGLSERRVKELRAEGVIPGAAGEHYDLQASVTAYCAHMRPSAGKAAGGGSSGANDLDAARVRLLTAQAEAREMLNEQLRGDAVLGEDMEIAVGALVDAAKAKVLALPSKLAPALVGMTDLPAIQAKLTGALHECCDELAAGPAAEAVRYRARQRAGRGTGTPED